MTNEEFELSHSYELAIRNMNPIGWLHMNECERIDNLQIIENYEALKNHRIPAEIRSEPMSEYQNGFQYENSIVISQSLMDSENINEILETYFHEASHIQDWQASMFKELQVNYTENELLERNTIVPDPNIDWNGYWNHPAEIAAREAGTEGRSKTISHQEIISSVDADFHFHGSQILETYDYSVLEENSLNEAVNQDSHTRPEYEMGNINVEDDVETQVDI